MPHFNSNFLKSAALANFIATGINCLATTIGYYLSEGGIEHIEPRQKMIIETSAVAGAIVLTAFMGCGYAMRATEKKMAQGGVAYAMLPSVISMGITYSLTENTASLPATCIAFSTTNFLFGILNGTLSYISAHNSFNSAEKSNLEIGSVKCEENETEPLLIKPSP